MANGVGRVYLDCHGQVGLSNESMLRPGEEDKGDAVRVKSDIEVNCKARDHPNTVKEILFKASLMQYHIRKAFDASFTVLNNFI